MNMYFSWETNIFYDGFFRWETDIFYVFNCLVHAFTEEIKVTKI